ncbi:DUF7288 family protein [Haloarcula laminariae]|uniref:DUF7288 family protein n=1 Tax=Haloarcula laminariae TaxID=2961577 RepID=UPI0021C751B2|nr:hypothetical protein [Halomicroarcula laminariae]
MVSRGQAYTLEGVLAAILVVTATVYGLGAIDTRAWEDETRAETQQLQQRASDVLSIAGESGALEAAVRCYGPGRDITGDRFPQAPFESILNTTFDSQANQYNLYFSYWNNESDTRETRLASETSGEADRRPPSSAAIASTSVTLTDSMNRTTGPQCNPIGLSIKRDSAFYIEDANPSGPLYNVVEVRLVVW